ncbi:hypothetical protein Trydic_g6070 [Trypoxylus dichotomus]
MTFKKVTHVLFDLDGLIIDSEKGLDRIISDIARLFGKEYTWQARMKILGTPEKDTAKIAIKELGLPITVDEFIEIYREKVAKELKHPPLLPGAEKLIRHLYEHEIPIALATSSSKFTMDVKTQYYQKLFSMFNHQVLGSTDPDVKYGKPAPDIFLVCASRFDDNPKPQHCLVFEDAPNGVKAARSAGMQVVMVPTKEVSEELKKPATLVLNSLTEFRPEVFGLPPYEI